MATKSVIDIDINDEKFKEFQRLFEKYQSSLGKMPNQWGKINKEVSSLQGNFNRVQHALDTIASRLDKNYKTLQNTDQVVNKTEKHFQSIGKTAASISKNVAATTFNLLKWGSVGAALGLLGSAGGLFGLGSLAGAASDTRRQAQGFGVTAGELKAAQVNFQRVADVNSLLSTIAGAQTDITKQYAFGAAQVNPNQSAAQLLPQLLRRAGEVYKAGSPATAQQRLEVSGLSALGIDVETARRMASLRKGEMDDLEKKYAADTKTLALTDALLKRWQDLDVQLSRSKQKIENVFISGLEGLVTPLDNLSDSFSNAVKAFLENPKLKEWIGTLGVKLEEFAKYLEKPEFKTDVENFLTNVGKIGEAALDLAEAIIWLAGIVKNPLNPGNLGILQKGMPEGKSEFDPSREGMKKGFKAWWNNLSKVDPTLAEIAMKNDLKVISGGGYRSKKEEEDLGKVKGADGQWRTKSGHLTTPPGVTSKHTFGQAIDIDTEQAKKLTDEDLRKMGLYRPYKDPTEINHLELIKSKLEGEKSNNKGEGVPQAPSPQGSSYSSNLGSLNWNPTPIALSIQTTKIPGQDTNIDMLKAGGYYTGIGIR